ncbi:hypothetical protein SOVF_006580 [Spinacia oleracea]|nr:hypothetical protein SOVF_006580 [Spinacia oleracea]
MEAYVHALTLWFDVQELSEEAPDDQEGLDAIVTHEVNLLSTEPTDKKRRQHQGSSSCNVIDLEENISEEQHSPTFTTEIMFRTISTTVTTTAARLTRTTQVREQLHDEDAESIRDPGK